MWSTSFLYHELKHIIYFPATLAGLVQCHIRTLLDSVVLVRSLRSHSFSCVFRFHVSLAWKFRQLYLFSLSSVLIAWCGVCSPAYHLTQAAVCSKVDPSLQSRLFRDVFTARNC